MTPDASLKANSDGTLAAKAPLNALTLSGGGSGPLATLSSSDGKTLSITMPFPLPTPTVDGATATYANVLPDVDLDVRATELGGIDEVLEVKTAAAAANPALASLRLTTSGDGLTMEDDGQGGLQAVDDSGTALFVAPTPTMWDSSTTSVSPSSKKAEAPSTGDGSSSPQGANAADPDDGNNGIDPSTSEGPGTGAQVAPIPVAVSGDSVSLTPDAVVLRGTNTHYPVYIDPSYLPWKAGDPTWTWTQSAHTGSDNFGQYGTSHSDQPGVGVCGTYPDGGSCSPSDKERTYYQFNVGGLNSAADKIGSATLKVTQTYSADWSCSNKYSIQAFYSQTAIGHSTDWDNQPGGTSIGTDSVGGTGSTGCSDNVDFSYDAAGAVNSSLSANSSTLTFGIHGDESDPDGLKRLSNKATLTVTYDKTPNLPSNETSTPTPRTASDGTTQACDATANPTTKDFLGNPGSPGLVLSAKVSSPTSPAQQVRGYFNFWDENQDNKQIAAGYSSGYASSGSTVSYTVPSSEIIDGHAYGWDVRANDGILSSGPAPAAHCHFRADFTAPTLTVPTAPTQLRADQLPVTFPPSGNGQTTGVLAGGGGWVPFTASDPAPSGGVASGLACMRWSFDPTLSDAGWQCGSNLPGTSGMAAFPSHWGTNILYAQAEDNAGNYSGIVSYAFYVPWNPKGPAPAFGDTTGDGSPDIVIPGTDGNLYAHTVPGNSQALSPAVSLAAKQGDSPDGDSWQNYQTAHRGSMRSGLNVDDLITHKAGSAELDFYYNPGNTGTDGRFDKRKSIPRPMCTDDGSGSYCSDYAQDWTHTLQIVAVGDVSSSALDSGHFGNRTGLVTTEATSSGDAALWFFPTIDDGQFGQPVRLSANGWKNWDLISPGDSTDSGKPGLWARERTTGEIDSFTFTTGTLTPIDDFGDPLPSVPTVTAISAPVKIGTLTAATDPVIGSDGDLTGDGIPDLWSVTPTGSLSVRAGRTSDGTANSSVTGFATHSTIGNTGSAADQWPLKNSTADTDTNNPATAHGSIVWAPDHMDAASSAATFDGSTSYLQSQQAALDTSQSYTVSAWVKVNSTAATVTAVSQGSINHQAFYLGYQAPTHSWYFGTITTDEATGAALPAAIGGTRDASGAEQPPTTGVWTLLTGVYDADTGVQTLYVNGVASNTAASNPTPVYAPGGHLNIGANLTIGSTAPYNQWPGSIADVRTFPAALTAGEVNHLYTTS